MAVGTTEHGVGQQFLQMAREALAGYSLPEVRTSPIRLDNNAVFRVERRVGAGWAPSYVLRIHRRGYRRPEQTRAELQYVQSLGREAPDTVPEVVLTRGGDTITLVEDRDGGKRHCDLLTWLPGRVRRPGSGLGRRSVYRLGETLARMHEHAACFDPPPGFDLPCWDADGLLSQSSSFNPGPLEEILGQEDLDLFRMLHGRVEALFEALGRSREQFGVIHADFILGNCLFSGPRPRVVDFDDCGWGFFLYDMGPILGNFRDYPSFEALKRSFLAGYRAVRPLPPEYEAHFPLLMATRHATSVLWAAGLIRHGDLSAEGRRHMQEHIAYRLAETRSCLGELA